jgi:hypothetical protein
LITGEDGKIFNLVAAGVTAICAVVADQRAIAKEEEVCIAIEKNIAGVASKAVLMGGSDWSNLNRRGGNVRDANDYQRAQRPCLPTEPRHIPCN